MNSKDVNDIKMAIKKNTFYNMNEQFGEQQHLIDLLEKYAGDEDSVSKVLRNLKRSNKELSIELDTIAKELGIE